MERRRLIYGRRRGHRLRAGRQAVLEAQLPEIGFQLDDTPAGGLDVAGLFAGRDPAPRALWLEIGFGAGEHLAWQAAAHPDVGIIGCEPFINGVAALCQKVDAAGLRNVRIFQDDARLLLAALPEESVERAFVLFPDPWPKKRHHKRRIIHPETIPALCRVLQDGGELRVATDDPGYGRWILMHLGRVPALAWTARRARDWQDRPDDWPATRYEAKAIAAGRAPLYLSYRRVGRAKCGK